MISLAYVISVSFILHFLTHFQFFFLQAFVACGWGISRIGYVMIGFGAANAIAALLATAISKVVGRTPILFATLILHGSLLIWMHEWTAVANDFVAYFTMAFIWGLADGIWLVIINCKISVAFTSMKFTYKRLCLCFICQFTAYYGILFPGKEEAAFSNFRLFEATGSVITYSLNPLFCTHTKLIALFVLMIVGMLG